MHSIININMIVLELCNVINIAIIAIIFQSMMPKVYNIICQTYSIFLKVTITNKSSFIT